MGPRKRKGGAAVQKLTKWHRCKPLKSQRVEIACGEWNYSPKRSGREVNKSVNTDVRDS